MPITYPIQDSDRFTIYDSNTEAPLKNSEGKSLVNQKWGSSDKSQMIQGLEPNIKWLIQVSDSFPSFDQWTQKVDSSVSYDLANEEARTEHVVVDLSQEEIDAITPEHFTTSQGIKLHVREESQNAFSRLINLINNAAMADTDTVDILDVYETKHTLTVLDFKNEMTAYGAYCYTLFFS